MEIGDFTIEETNKGERRRKQNGDDPKIDKCFCLLDPKFPTFHLVKQLLNNDIDKQVSGTKNI